MKKIISHVGLDVHKSFIQVALLQPGCDEPVEWRLNNEPRKVAGLIRKLQKLCDGEVQLCYEAGPCGYALSRQLNAVKGFSCMVIAPSLIPRKPGERIKTDRRDATKLAEYLRAGLLTEVRPPTVEDEARRELSRARAAAKDDEKTAKHRLSKFLLRQGRVFRGGKSSWTGLHFAWLEKQRFEQPGLQTTFETLLWALEQAQLRVAKVEAAIEEASQDRAVAEPIALLQCFKGVAGVTAFSLATELYSFERFTTPTGLMAFLGMTPSEYSTGGNPNRGGITKAGNGRLRRLMVEAARNAVRSPYTGNRLKKRREGKPSWALAIADRAQRRLRSRYLRLVKKGKEENKAIMAVAREFIGFIWAMLAEHRTRQLEANA